MLNRTSIDRRRSRSPALLALTFAVVALVGAQGELARAAETSIDRMPPQLETRFALSALPPALRDRATVYLLEPGKGYRLSRQGTSGVACLVERTAWELADFRNDIYIPLCYDAAGTRTYLQVIMDTAVLRAQGMSPAQAHEEIAGRYRDKTYKAPEKTGVSYMLAPVMRTVGPPDMKVHTMAMPHLMYYAPGVTNNDLGAVPDLGQPDSLRYPFIDTQGIPEQNYIIQLVGDAEKAKILASEKVLLEDLCSYRKLLCLEHRQH
ncbi:hypothetical protein NX773_22730 [Massilia solisilvae]|uniref:Uncharacterized protein n=1 Tax=Massilia solisilvae TaxID=1811225 RepID=A0ABT2BR41_9BURK|nr:hypothetical protein [Massilia solisilvae]MCS0610982.1 hypothetical protein [Massilia solisilvae]